MGYPWDWSVITENAGLILSGIQTTISLALITMILSTICGLLLVVLRLSVLKPVSVAATIFVELFRSTPLLLQLYWVVYVAPVVFGLRVDVLTACVVGLVCNVSAFTSEVFRAGIISIPQVQRDAALALGMTESEAFRRIILPQLLRRVQLPLANIWISVFKDTTLVSIVGVADLSFNLLWIRSRTYRVLETLIALAVLYILMGYPQAKLIDWLYRKLGYSSNQ